MITIEMDAAAARRKTLENRNITINITKENVMGYISRAVNKGLLKASCAIPKDESIADDIAYWLKELGYEVEVDHQFWNIKW